MASTASTPRGRIRDLQEATRQSTTWQNAAIPTRRTGHSARARLTNDVDSSARRSTRIQASLGELPGGLHPRRRSQRCSLHSRSNERCRPVCATPAKQLRAVGPGSDGRDGDDDLQGSQGLSLSRLSLPFLVENVLHLESKSGDGHRLPGNLRSASAGSRCCTSCSLRASGWRPGGLGALLGFLHGLFLLAAALRTASCAHPSWLGARRAEELATSSSRPGFRAQLRASNTDHHDAPDRSSVAATLGGLCQLAGVV